MKNWIHDNENDIILSSKVKLYRNLKNLSFPNKLNSIVAIEKSRSIYDILVKEIEHNRIITIVGCGGNRDKTKRPEMGIISTDLSDIVIFTSDNPRNENELDIINDMIQKVDKKNYEIESNREKAIVKGIQMLENNDILLVLGKGHETYQIIGDERIPFDDKVVIQNNI